MCGYQTEGGDSLFVMLSNGPNRGIDWLPHDPEHATRRTLGPFPAHEAATGSRCAFDVELVPGRALRVTTGIAADPDPCGSAEAIATRAIQRLAG